MCVYNELYIDYIDDLAAKMIHDLGRGVKIVNAVAKYSEAVNLIKALLQDEDLFLGEVEVSKPENSCYYREYLITIIDGYEVYCSPLYDEESERYLDYDSEITYIFENCSRKAVANCRVNDVTVVYYGFLDREYDDPANELNAKDMAETENKDIDKSKDKDLHKNVKIVVHFDDTEKEWKNIGKEVERIVNDFRKSFDWYYKLP